MTAYQQIMQMASDPHRQERIRLLSEITAENKSREEAKRNRQLADRLERIRSARAYAML